MTNICKIKGGSFYYIEKLDEIYESFADALGIKLFLINRRINDMCCVKNLNYITMCSSCTILGY